MTDCVKRATWKTGDNRGSGSGADKHIDHTKTCKKKSSSSASKDVKPDTVPVISGSPNRFCQACKDSITCEEFVACDICKINLHSDCVGLPSETVEKLLDIVQHTGWVCNSCRLECSSKIAQLQSTLVQLSEKFADVVAKVSELESQISVSAKETKHANDYGGADVKLSATGDLNIEIHKTLVDINRRKNNVVISGLPEVLSDDSVDCDKHAFEQLCEENFSVKPTVSKLGCRRLGKRTDGQQPRQLLVHLNSEQAASTLLAEARKLRKSDSEAVARNVVARNVFLNPDLSPAELRLAYDRRQKRRTQRHREQVTLREQLDN